MPDTITFRVRPEERAGLERRAAEAGQSLSDYIRTTLVLREQAPDFSARLNEHGRTLFDHERRLARLEEMAGL